MYGSERVDVRKKKAKEIGRVWFNTMFACPASCGGITPHGDRLLTYPAGGTSLVKNLAKDEVAEPGCSRNSLRKSKRVTRREKAQMRVEGFIEPPGLERHAPPQTIEEVYTAKGIRPPRENIRKLLLEAHANGLVTDAYNQRRNEMEGCTPVAKAPEGAPRGSGPYSVKRNPDEHVLVFDRLEIDKACKNEKMDVNMKLILVLRCLDDANIEESEKARKFLLDMSGKQRQFNEKRREKLVYDAYCERVGKKFSRRRNYGLDDYGNEILTGQIVSTQPYRGDIRLIDYDGKRKYFGRQRQDSASKYPPVHHRCPLLCDISDLPSTSSSNGPFKLAKIEAK